MTTTEPITTFVWLEAEIAAAETKEEIDAVLAKLRGLPPCTARLQIVALTHERLSELHQERGEA